MPLVARRGDCPSPSSGNPGGALGEGSSRRLVDQLIVDLLFYYVRVFQHVIRRKPDYLKAVLVQLLRKPVIVIYRSGIKMLTTIQFDNAADLEAREIGALACHRELSTQTEPGKALTTEDLTEFVLCVGRFPLHLTGEVAQAAAGVASP